MRTTRSDVKAVIQTALEDNEIQILMEMANRMVTESLLSSSLSTAVLKDIETWLSAHLIAIGKERQPSEEKVQDIWIRYQGKFGESLRSTTFGQMVLMLDTSGAFDSTTKRKVSFNAIPQDPDSTIHDA